MQSNNHPGGKYYSLGLIGWPIEHSFSPQIHLAALQSVGLQGEYRLYPSPPDERGEIQIRELLGRMRAGSLHGLNVTIPHKKTVIPYLDDLSEDARAIGAVNMIHSQQGRLIGENTDARGFWTDVQRLLVGRAHTALVLGAGGAARSVVFTLMRAGWQVYVAGRKIAQAQQLTGELEAAMVQGERAGSYHTLLYPLRLYSPAWEGIVDDCSLIVNCTPVGMAPSTDASPWPDDLPFPPGAAVYDLVYNPAETNLVKAARRAGLPAMTGVGMLIEQAALAFERWTALPADRSVMWAAVNVDN